MSRKQELRKQYEAARWGEPFCQECASCGGPSNTSQMDRHHPAGRHGTNILRYIYLCRACHTECHADPKEATRRGLLWPGRNTHDITDKEWRELLATIKQNQHLI